VLLDTTTDLSAPKKLQIQERYLATVPGHGLCTVWGHCVGCFPSCCVSHGNSETGGTVWNV